MTRSESLKQVEAEYYATEGQYLRLDDVSELLNKIYDDFEDELAIAFDEGQAEAFEDIENRLQQAYIDGSNDCYYSMRNDEGD